MSQRKKFLMGKIFEIDIFVLKHVLDHYKSILTKKIFFEKFSIFFGHFSSFFGPKHRKFFENFFLVGTDLEWSKTRFKAKISILKIFPVENFFWDIAVFFRKISDQKIENFRKIFLVGIDLEWSKTCFKTKISILKIFSVEILFSGT